MPPARQRLTMEQEPFLVVRSFASRYGNGTVIEPHQQDWHQLVYARSGAMQVQAARQTWMIPPGKSVFVPAGCTHSIRMWGEVGMNSLAFVKALAGPDVSGWDCRVISVTPLLRELVLRVVAM